MTELARGNLHDAVWALAALLLALESVRSMVRLCEEFMDGPR